MHFILGTEIIILLQKEYEKAGIDFSVHIKMGCDHHPHGLENPEGVLRFILNHSK